METKLSTGGIHYKSGDTVTVSVTMNVYTHIGFDDAEEELKRMEEFRKAQAEVEQKKEKPMSQKMFKVVYYGKEMTLRLRLGRFFVEKTGSF